MKGIAQSHLNEFQSTAMRMAAKDIFTASFELTGLSGLHSFLTFL